METCRTKKIRFNRGTFLLGRCVYEFPVLPGGMNIHALLVAHQNTLIKVNSLAVYMAAQGRIHSKEFTLTYHIVWGWTGKIGKIGKIQEWWCISIKEMLL